MCHATLIALLAASTALAASFHRSDVRVLVHDSEGNAASPAIQRVLAVAGDRIRVDTRAARVNGRTVPGVSKPLLKVCGTWDQIVPEGHYFVAGEETSSHS